jgi:hypothetical protein
VWLSLGFQVNPQQVTQSGEKMEAPVQSIQWQQKNVLDGPVDEW